MELQQLYMKQYYVELHQLRIWGLITTNMGTNNNTDIGFMVLN